MAVTFLDTMKLFSRERNQPYLGLDRDLILNAEGFKANNGRNVLVMD